MCEQTLLATIPISKQVQRISISPDGKFVFTQDKETPRIVVIDTATKAFVRSISLPQDSVLFRDHKRRLLAPRQLRIRKALCRRCRQWSTYKTFDSPDVPVLPTPGGFALTPDGIPAYVSCPQGGTIEILNLRDWKLEEPLRLRKGVDGMAWVPA